MTLAEVLSYAIPVAIGVVTSVLSAALITPRKLRHELSVESEMVDRLPPASRGELKREIDRRAVTLVSLIRFPTVTTFDVLALLGLAAVAAFDIVAAIETHREGAPEVDFLDPPLILPIITLSAAAACWLAFYVPWSTRAANRHDYVEEHLGVPAAEDLARLLKIGMWVAVGLGLLTVVGPPIAVALVESQVHGWAIGWRFLAVLLILGLTALTLFRPVIGAKSEPGSGRLWKTIERSALARLAKEIEDRSGADRESDTS